MINKNHLIEYFYEGIKSKTKMKIGVEHEKFILNKDTLLPVSYDEINGIKNISSESLIYHASRNHFSNWLAVRGEFQLANEFRKLKNSHFDDTEARRNYHISLLKEIIHQNQTFLKQA